MNSKSVAEMAHALAQAHASKKHFGSIADRLPHDPIDHAYAIQDYLVELWKPRHGSPCGHKIGLTSPRMQTMCGISEPVAGQVLQRRLYADGDRVSATEFIHLGIESELCVVLASDLPCRTQEYSLAEIENAVGHVACAFELIDDRHADYASLDAPSLIADNCWNAGVVLGRRLPKQAVVNLRGSLKVNGQTVDSGNSSDALGNPFEAVRWLSRKLQQRGLALHSGDLIMTGSIVPTRFPTVGEQYGFELEGFPPVTLFID